MKQMLKAKLENYTFKTSLNKKLDTKLMDGAYSKIMTLLTELKEKKSETKVIEFMPPEVLRTKMDFKLSYDKPATTEELLDYVQKNHGLLRQIHPQPLLKFLIRRIKRSRHCRRLYCLIFKWKYLYL